MEEYQRNRRDELNALLWLMKKQWSTEVTTVARNILRERRQKRTVKAPSEDDLRKLAEFLKTALAALDLSNTGNYRKCAQLVLARLLVYNKRRSGELEQTR